MFIVVMCLIIGYPLVIIPTFVIMMLHALFGANQDQTTYVVHLGHEEPTPRTTQELRECIWRYINGNPNGYIHISKWNIAHITDMSCLCENMITTKQRNDALSGIEEWDMSHVRTTFAMFKWCNAFNQPIGKWKLHNVYRISQMFQGCGLFREKQNLDEWETTLGRFHQRVECYDVFQSAIIPENELPHWLAIQRKKQQDYDANMEHRKPLSFAERVAMASKPSTPFVPNGITDEWY